MQQLHFQPVLYLSEHSTKLMSSQIFFKDYGVGLSSVKSTCAGDGIVAAAAGDGSVSATTSDGNGDVSVDADYAGYGSVADAAGDESVAVAAGDGSAVGRTVVSGGIGTGAYGALHLYTILF